MTCIVAVATGRAVWMGGDSAYTVSDDVIRLGPPKVTRRGPLVVGAAGSLRCANILHYDFTAPKRRRANPLRYVACEVAAEFRRRLGASEGKDQLDGHSEWDGRALVGYVGRLFLLDSCFGVTELVDGYGAIGSGGEVALGSLYETRGQPAKERLRRALLAAEAITGSVRAPFTYEVLT
jgi:ATP-dependent protease HslVU (ClpYQ) peptidase subunit